MSRQGLPDFAQPIQLDRGLVFYPYEGVGPFLVVPSGLTVGDRGDGQPDFGLTLVRGQSPLLPPKPYGMLDFALQPEVPIAAALMAVRQPAPQALVQPVTFSSGWLRLYPAVKGAALAAELTVPIGLAWNGLTTGRYHLRLTDTTAVMLKGALISQVLQIMARAELEIVGIAPRLPLTVQFDPAVLLAQLVSLGNGQRQVADAAIVEYFRQDPALLPLTLSGAMPAREDFALTMADWVRAHYGQFGPAATATSPAMITLATATPGLQTWDLAQPQVTARTVVLTLDPLESARQLVQAQGLNAVLHETIVPPLPTGTLAVTVQANLPAPLLGVLALGVTLTAPPVLPHRPQAKIASAELTAALEAGPLRLQLSPLEPPQYTVATYVILADAQGAEQLWSAEMPGQGDRLLLQPNQFPVNFITVGADRALLQQATLQGQCCWQEGDTARSQPFTLTGTQPLMTLALPKTALHPTLEFTARSIAGTQTRTIAPFPARNYQVGLHSFPEFGPQQVPITCEFVDHRPFYAIDLQPEASTDISLLMFTPAAPEQVWQWLVSSPFQSGYRYRPHRDPGLTVAEWSPDQSPGIALTLKPVGDL
jgi:hypothetical protein